MGKADQTFPERRALKRVTVMTEVFSGGRSGFGFGKGENISEGGMKIEKIESSQMDRPDTVIKVRFVLPVCPKAVAVEVQAKIVWTEQNSAGIQFIDLQEEFREAISKFVEGSAASNS